VPTETDRRLRCTWAKAAKPVRLSAVLTVSMDWRMGLKAVAPYLSQWGGLGGGGRQDVGVPERSAANAGGDAAYVAQRTESGPFASWASVLTVLQVG